jgi:hypothetical protein
MAAAMADVDAAVMAGQNDKAYALLKSAGADLPDRQDAVGKRWPRCASTAPNYGQAIVDALEALERDPDDTLANSIVAVSGLRVSSKALADLSQKNNLSGNVRTEAEELAKLLRTSLGEEVLVAGGRPAAARPGQADPARGDRGAAPAKRRHPAATPSARSNNPQPAAGAPLEHAMAKSESVQKRLQKVRAPRVQMTYDVEIGDAIENKELPFVVGVLGDFGNDPDAEKKRLKDRNFVSVDADNFDEVLNGVAPVPTSASRTTCRRGRRVRGAACSSARWPTSGRSRWCSRSRR